MSLLKVNEVQNYNGSSLTLTASTVSTSAQLNTGGNISVTGSINVSDDSTTRSNLGLGTIATQDSSNVTITGGNISNATLASSVTFPANTVHFIDFVSVTSPGTIDSDTDNTAWQDTGLSITIPSATVALYSKIYLSAVNSVYITASTFAFINLRLQRSAPSASTLVLQDRYGIESSTISIINAPFVASVCDESLGSGDHTYKMQYQEGATVWAGNIYPLGRTGSVSTITAFGII